MAAVLELLRRHVSCREYLPEPVPKALIEDLVRAAQQAATDATGQLYSLVRVKDPPLRAEVARLSGDQRHVHEAPEFFVVLLDTHRLRRLLSHRGERYGMKPLVALLFGITDAGLFAQSLALAAEDLGYGTCFIGGVQNHAREIARKLGLPAGVLPLYGLTLGRPAQTLPPKPRLPFDMVLHTDRYRDPTDDELGLAFQVMARATRSGDWVNPIRKYFAEGGVMEGREQEFRGLLQDQGMAPE